VIGLWVGLGGGLGALARFAMSGWVTTWAFAGFPWGTFAVNLIGSAALGSLSRALPAPTASPATRAFLGMGLCGGFTTFSTFDFETISLIQRGAYTTAAAYSLGSAAVCIAGVYAGARLTAPIVRQGATEADGA